MRWAFSEIKQISGVKGWRARGLGRQAVPNLLSAVKTTALGMEDKLKVTPPHSLHSVLVSDPASQQPCGFTLLL